MIRTKSVKPKKSWSRFSVLIIVFLLVLFGTIIFREIFNEAQLDDEVLALNEEISQLKLEQENFLSLIDDYESDFFIEKQSRLKLNKKKPEENVIVVKLDEINKLENEQYQLAQSQEQEISTNNFVLWWQYFFSDKIN